MTENQPFTRNSNGVLIGTLNGVTRVSAFLYEVPSSSKPRCSSKGLKRAIYEYAFSTGPTDSISYLVYVEHLHPPVTRCQCEDFLLHGHVCKHGRAAIIVAKALRDLDPNQYQDELADRTDRRANA